MTTFWGPDFDQLEATDPEIAGVLLDELDRLRGGLQLIASENLTSPAVLAALGSTLTNKYAEGYPGRRYYGGCDQVDEAEQLGMDLPHGGHLTHGSRVNFSGTWFNPVGYTVRQDTELIDYDQVRDLALRHQPKMIICGATA